MIVYTTEKFFIEQKKILFILIAYVSKVFWKFQIPTTFNFDVIYPQNLLFS